MWLRLDLDGVEMRLRIRDYVQSTEDGWHREWCSIDFHLQSKWINYPRNDAELLLSVEVESLRDDLEAVFDGRIIRNFEVRHVEPDLRFFFTVFDKDGRRVTPMADLRVSFWNHGLTNNYLSLRFDVADLDALWQYLRLVTGEADLSDPRVRFWLDKGTILPEYGG